MCFTGPLRVIDLLFLISSSLPFDVRADIYSQRVLSILVDKSGIRLAKQAWRMFHAHPEMVRAFVSYPVLSSHVVL
jgi:hypothetical protein